MQTLSRTKCQQQTISGFEKEAHAANDDITFKVMLTNVSIVTKNGREMKIKMKKNVCNPGQCFTLILFCGLGQ